MYDRSRTQPLGWLSKPPMNLTRKFIQQSNWKSETISWFSILYFIQIHKSSWLSKHSKKCAALIFLYGIFLWCDYSFIGLCYLIKISQMMQNVMFFTLLMTRLCSNNYVYQNYLQNTFDIWILRLLKNGFISSFWLCLVDLLQIGHG